MEGCLCRGHKHLDRGSGAWGAGVRGRDFGGGVQRKCLGENENDGWRGICRKVCACVSMCFVCVAYSETKPYQPPPLSVTAGVGLC